MSYNCTARKSRRLASRWVYCSLLFTPVGSSYIQATRVIVVNNEPIMKHYCSIVTILLNVYQFIYDRLTYLATECRPVQVWFLHILVAVETTANLTFQIVFHVDDTRIDNISTWRHHAKCLHALKQHCGTSSEQTNKTKIHQSYVIID